MARSFTKLVPFFDRVLIERFVAETKSKGGIMIPEKAAAKTLEGTVVAVGPGARLSNGTTVPVSVKPGDVVMLPEYGGTKITMQEKEFVLLKESDILGKLE